MRAPLLATLALTTSAKLSPEWRVVAENRGVVTRARIDEASQLCAVHGEAVVGLSMAELMTVFLDLEQYDKWDDTLVEKRQWRADGADFIYQRFQQPWPVRDRELVLKMTTYPYPDENRLAVRYESVWWNFTAVSETETLISHYSCVDPGGAIPGWARDLVVQKWCASQILALVETAKELGLAPVEEFLGWGAPKAVELLSYKAQSEECEEGGVATCPSPTPRPVPPEAAFAFEP
ncbi:hypothetical protein JL722_11392 [Aureococcus anophagefferens]|nr:hypothetical protein JL722_11392 [Aureococcus anophagefferens]